eukprot:gene8872-biopygen11882
MRASKRVMPPDEGVAAVDDHLVRLRVIDGGVVARSVRSAAARFSASFPVPARRRRAAGGRQLRPIVARRGVVPHVVQHRRVRRAMLGLGERPAGKGLGERPAGKGRRGNCPRQRLARARAALRPCSSAL